MLNSKPNLNLPNDIVDPIDCPICGNREFEYLFMKRGERFVRCLQCTLMLINPPPDVSVTNSTYDQHYSQAYIDKARKKLKRCAGWVARMQRRFDGRGKWLDVGCSAGFVVKAATDAGFDAYGVELEPAAVTFARDTLGLEKVSRGLLEEQGYPSEGFDVVTLYDVIEHVPNLNRLMAEMHRILAPEGIIEIRTPNVSHWRTPRDLSRWKEVKPSEHLYYFNQQTLRLLFEKHGFRTRYQRKMFKPALDVYFSKTP
jgi:2-polyprenyl-3-methyl-5-hydroxy-6-metoxy-1,4-benzoquinol methylase